MTTLSAEQCAWIAGKCGWRELHTTWRDSDGAIVYSKERGLTKAGAFDVITKMTWDLNCGNGEWHVWVWKSPVRFISDPDPVEAVTLAVIAVMGGV